MWLLFLDQYFTTQYTDSAVTFRLFCDPIVSICLVSPILWHAHINMSSVKVVCASLVKQAGYYHFFWTFSEAPWPFSWHITLLWSEDNSFCWFSSAGFHDIFDTLCLVHCVLCALFVCAWCWDITISSDLFSLHPPDHSFDISHCYELVIIASAEYSDIFDTLRFVHCALCALCVCAWGWDITTSSDLFLCTHMTILLTYLLAMIWRW